MHYLLSAKLRRSILSTFIILLSFNSFAQNTAPQSTQTQPAATTQPAQTAPAQKVDPAQISNQQAVDFYKQAKTSGMSDMDIERAALQKGYTLDQISAMRKRLLNPDKNAKEVKNPNREALDETREQNERDTESNNEKDSTNSQKATVRKENRTFGASFFSTSANSFEPNLRIATPRNYILGPEDELVVDIYGNYVDNFKMKISPEGTVKMLNLAPVYVNGMTIEQATERIVSRLRQAYSSLNRPGSGTYLSLTLGNVRSISVLITGEAARPGTYTVSSLATAFNALSVSGGPNENGSYRNIEIIRNNKILKKIDLYHFLVDADLKDNIALQDQDIILIRPYDSRIELKGEFKRQGIFEAKSGEKFMDLVRYAGGFTPEAYTSLFTYQRNTGTNYIIGSIDSTQMLTFTPRNGDIFTVRKILDAVSNQVEVRGAVTIPGNYALEERCNTVLKLISLAQGLSQRAFLNRAILERVSGDTQTGIIAIDLRKLINKEINDIPLQPGDILTIKSIEDLKEFTYLSISGSVINPGNYYYYKDITIADLIFQAGGYTEGGVPYRIEVSRRIKNDTLDLPSTQNVRIFTMEVTDKLALNSEDQKFKLFPYDIITVRKSPRYESQKLVTILGEVKYPGKYTIVSNFERITDLFPKAGGLKPEAYLRGAKFYRNQELVAVDLDAITRKPTLPANLLLLNGDTLMIPRQSETVRIQGAVQNPSLVNFDSEFSFEEYISQAGGYAEQAWKNRIYVSYPNGRTHRMKRFLFFKSYPTVEPGSTIIIPQKAINQHEKTPGERVALYSFLLSSVSTLTLLFISLNNK
ncbi:SLBB domain-containing protein [Dyadobacter sp. CY356]|uniref:SLBB domain-containing protein n=1 Tax=Dyadobacter sp. CY356 TaxID=2906442 RepID=UPI001F4119F6|nr:SLBB domain-containing protein [Dyadobacter sp. CY356]MCF0058304.1 SLBB domain-containing protein [Dyadobacter sp. CY356]